jgi:hypothetical protein
MAKKDVKHSLGVRVMSTKPLLSTKAPEIGSALGHQKMEVRMEIDPGLIVFPNELLNLLGDLPVADEERGALMKGDRLDVEDALPTI